MTRCSIATFILLLFFALNNAVSAEVPRHILALYNSNLGQTSRDNLIHENVEVILNHLGCVVDYWDLKDGLPDENQMQKYLGVLSWFHGNYTKQPNDYFRWASRQLQAGRKFVILGDIGDYNYANESMRKTPNVNFRNFCNQLGLRLHGDWSNDITEIELVYKDSEIVEFERSLDYELDYYIKVSSTNPQNRVYLRLKKRNTPNSESDLVFTTPNGAFACTPYVYYQNPRTFKKKWRINPFKFFEEAFALKGKPRPDGTTLNGLRIWCSHIDGDALISASQVKPNSYCGEIIRDEILKKYKWPVSVSVVVAEVERGQKFVDIARSIFRLPWIEPASHSYSHPFYWADDYKEKDKYASRHLPVAGYTFNLKQEIIGSIRYINQTLLPPNKKVQQFFWTGNCEPTPESIKLCEKIRVHNINGGDTVFNKSTPSYTGVAPFGADVGGYRQIYAPNSNENIYTNEWKGPYYGFKFVLDTFKNTESPVRIKPIDIYYHFYIGERWASLNSLKEVLEKTMVLEVAPMFISEYIAIVRGFFSTQVEEISEDAWRIKNFGKCTTIRFDNTQKYPDFEKSSGLLGFLHLQGSLYVHLQEGREVVLALTDSKPAGCYLEQASHRLARWKATREQVSFKTEGYGQGRFVIANLFKKREYRILIKELKSNAGTKAKSLITQTDAAGKLAFRHPMNGPVSVKIDLVP